MKHISLILGKKIIEILDSSRADEPEKFAALNIAGAIVPVSQGSTWARTVEREEAEKAKST